MKTQKEEDKYWYHCGGKHRRCPRALARNGIAATIVTLEMAASPIGKNGSPATLPTQFRLGLVPGAVEGGRQT
ncbi:hypothetical protein CUJ84_pRLN1000570 (plasmid) [Rhizobium leguminosarum]|uniref:Uncharacterized protein n=1 Tax=Rhizobium leguminosarum TaxID=384 RepID=A0A2K9ZCV2_RHILE|nr:hypothetical protein CUJ84_pRLN1000570 [Rhizobium leguminosarum]